MKDLNETQVKYKPMTRKQHLTRGYCCQSGCLHCPWDYSGKGNPPITVEEQEHYQIVFSQNPPQDS